MCRIERWDVRTLRQKIGGMLFERTALSKKPKAIVATEIAKLRDGMMSPRRSCPVSLFGVSCTEFRLERVLRKTIVSPDVVYES